MADDPPHSTGIFVGAGVRVGKVVGVWVAVGGLVAVDVGVAVGTAMGLRILQPSKDGKSRRQKMNLPVRTEEREGLGFIAGWSAIRGKEDFPERDPA